MFSADEAEPTTEVKRDLMGLGREEEVFRNSDALLYFSACSVYFLDTENYKLAMKLNPVWHFLQGSCKVSPLSRSSPHVNINLVIHHEQGL